jgi:hypothetical protein
VISQTSRISHEFNEIANEGKKFKAKQSYEYFTLETLNLKRSMWAIETYSNIVLNVDWLPIVNLTKGTLIPLHILYF